MEGGFRMSEQRGASREQRGAGTEQRAASREQRAESSEQRVKSSGQSVSFSVLCALCSLLLSSCNPWFFSLQRHTGWDIEGKILGHKERVDVVNQNTVFVEAPAAIAIRCYQITDGVFDTEMTLDRHAEHEADDEVVLRLDSTPYEDSVMNSDRGEHLVISHNNVSIAFNGEQQRVLPVAMPPAGTPFRVRLIRHGRYLNVEVACTDLGQFLLGDASTQWITIAPQGSQRIQLRDPMFHPLTEEEFPPVTTEHLNERLGQ